MITQSSNSQNMIIIILMTFALNSYSSDCESSFRITDSSHSVSITLFTPSEIELIRNQMQLSIEKENQEVTDFVAKITSTHPFDTFSRDSLVLERLKVDQIANKTYLNTLISNSKEISIRINQIHSILSHTLFTKRSDPNELISLYGLQVSTKKEIIFINEFLKIINSFIKNLSQLHNKDKKIDSQLKEKITKLKNTQKQLLTYISKPSNELKKALNQADQFIKENSNKNNYKQTKTNPKDSPHGFSITLSTPHESMLDKKQLQFIIQQERQEFTNLVAEVTSIHPFSKFFDTFSRDTLMLNSLSTTQVNTQIYLNTLTNKSKEIDIRINQIHNILSHIPPEKRTDPNELISLYGFQISTKKLILLTQQDLKVIEDHRKQLQKNLIQPHNKGKEVDSRLEHLLDEEIKNKHEQFSHNINNPNNELKEAIAQADQFIEKNSHNMQVDTDSTKTH